MFGSCFTSRLVLGALGGYSVASLTHSPTWSWMGAAVGALAVYLWSRRGRARSGGWCGTTGCAVPEREAVNARSEDSQPVGGPAGPAPERGHPAPVGRDR